MTLSYLLPSVVATLRVSGKMLLAVLLLNIRIIIIRISLRQSSRVDIA